MLRSDAEAVHSSMLRSSAAFGGSMLRGNAASTVHCWKLRGSLSMLRFNAAFGGSMLRSGATFGGSMLRSNPAIGWHGPAAMQN